MTYTCVSSAVSSAGVHFNNRGVSVPISLFVSIYLYGTRTDKIARRACAVYCRAFLIVCICACMRVCMCDMFSSVTTLRLL